MSVAKIDEAYLLKLFGYKRTNQDTAVVITLANKIVENNGLETALDPTLGTTLDTDELNGIQGYLACHLLTAPNPKSSSSNRGQSSTTIQGSFSDLGLRGTKWGQIVMTLDRTGILARLDARRDSETTQNASVSMTSL